MQQRWQAGVDGLQALGLRQHAQALGRDLAGVLLLSQPLLGWALAVLTLVQPEVGLCGFSALLLSVAVSRVIGVERTSETGAVPACNSFLVGLAVGWLLPVGAGMLVVLIAATVIVTLLAIALQAQLRNLGLPALSLPFALTAGLLFAVAGLLDLEPAAGGGLLLPAIDAWPPWLLPVAGFASAFGTILFTPEPAVGLAVALALFGLSRILFALAVFGYVSGVVLLGLLLGVEPPWLAVGTFNPMLTAMALGGTYLLPSRGSLIIALLAVAATVLIGVALQALQPSTGVPPLILPFNLATLGMLYGLARARSPLLAREIGATPEATVERLLHQAKRFGPNQPVIALPFSGLWTVWQGFDGRWTHQGRGRYAYDFVITRDGRTHGADGTRLDDYYAYRQPVLSPVAGTVVAVQDQRPDNQPGAVDTEAPWGNHVVIDTGLGWWVELSHFARGSLRVRPGMTVVVGDLLGLCGNSGYSPQPHIHVQAQNSPLLGAETCRFGFADAIEGGHLACNVNPAEQASIAPLAVDQRIARATGLLLDQQLRFRARIGGRRVDDVCLSVRMQGIETCLVSRRGRLFFSSDRIGFYCYRLEGQDPWLAMIMATLPRIPFGGAVGMSWHDRVPATPGATPAQRLAHTLDRLLRPERCLAHYQAEWRANAVITGTLTEPNGRIRQLEVVLDRHSGLRRLRLGDHALERVDRSQAGDASTR